MPSFLFQMSITALLFVTLAGCKSPVPAHECGGDVLFGNPNSRSGLTAQQCRPTCDCGGSRWEAPKFSDAQVDALSTWTLLEPAMPPLESDPYGKETPAPAPAGTVCAVMTDGSGSKQYRLKTFPSVDEAERAGGQVTHAGGCGHCSSLTDLAVYIRQKDLTSPVRECGTRNMKGDKNEEQIQCLRDLGFTSECTQIWFYNTNHTRNVCLSECAVAALFPDEPENTYHKEDGALSDCIQCDEDKSGPVFKHYAGRTRRNTGIPSALCRPCSETLPLEHDYF